jgi:hypothetical protein
MRHAPHGHRCALGSVLARAAVQQMSDGPTNEEVRLYNDITQLAGELWDKSLQVTGLNTDPKLISIMLFKRLWSNHRGYTFLWKGSLNLESDIILRSAVEAAISIAANYVMRGAFVTLLRQDAAFTLQGQIKLHRESGGLEFVRDGEAVLRGLLSSLPTDTKAAKLNWQMLAQEGRSPQLYDFHRMLSGVSSHVTGLSVLRGVVGADGSTDLNDELSALTRKMHFMMMAGTTLQGSLRHAGMLDDLPAAEQALALTERMDALSWHWPGVAD